MKNKIRIIGVSIVALIWLAVCVVAWFGPKQEISTSERRPLEKFPEFTVETVLSGEFVQKFEDFTLDHFPARDTMRQLKSIVHYYIMQQKDNNDIFVHDGYASKLEYPLNQDSLDYANGRFNKVYEKYLKGKDVNIYMSIIPDKSYFIAESNGYLAMDYNKLYEEMASKNPWATQIDIRDKLQIEDYYKTDTHWRQEEIVDVAQTIYESMNTTKYNDDFTTTKIERPFYGVYYGQAALPMNPEDMYILSNSTIDNCTVLDHETNKTLKVYEESSQESQDLYDVYLSGAKALLTITNPNATSDKELVIFRDSFGSSISPLLIQNYKTVTIVDIRYIASDYLGHFVKFNNQDVLFIYSTLVLNSSSTLK